MKISRLYILMLAIACLSACSSGEEYQSDVYSSSQVNQRQLAKTIEIIAILPAKVEVDNSKGKSRATTAGAILGAIAGGLLGNGHGRSGATTGAVLGGVGGAAAGSTVSATNLVEGVTLTYKENGQLYTSTQVGKSCMFKPGTALVITTKANETRVQPNSSCPQS